MNWLFFLCLLSLWQFRLLDFQNGIQIYILRIIFFLENRPLRINLPLQLLLLSMRRLLAMKSPAHFSESLLQTQRVPLFIHIVQFDQVWLLCCITSEFFQLILQCFVFISTYHHVCRWLSLNWFLLLEICQYVFFA